MNEELKIFLERIRQSELKYMYSFDIGDISFGVETDRYQWVNKVLEEKCSIEDMISYFEYNYPKDEKTFISYLKELAVKLD